MNIPTMRIVDYYAGNVISYFLSIYEKISRLFIKRGVPIVKEEALEILVMKYFGLGSILLSSPMFRALHETFPKAKITFLTFYTNREICERMQLADKHLFLRNDNMRAFLTDLVKVLIEFRRHRFNVAIDMEFFSKFSSIVTYLSFATKRLGFYVRNEPRTLLYTNPISFNYYKHITEIFLALAREIGADTKDLSLSSIKVYPGEREFSARLKEEHKMAGARLIIINVNTGQMSLERRWPKEYFVRLLNLLSKQYNLYFIFIGAKEDYNYVQEMVNLLDNKDNAVNLSGNTNLGELVSLFEDSDLFITNDSGPLHIACLTRIKTISFFGPETPVIYGPKNSNHYVFYKELYCSPCLNVYNVKTATYGNRRCFEGRNRCLRLITVEEVLDKVKQLLG